MRDEFRIAISQQTLSRGELRRLGHRKLSARPCHDAARAVSVCGEMAGDPAGAVALLGMGVDSLSLSSPRLPRIKKVIRTISRRQAEELLRRALAMPTAGGVRSLLNEALEQAEPGLLLGPAEIDAVNPA